MKQLTLCVIIATLLVSCSTSNIPQSTNTPNPLSTSINIPPTASSFAQSNNSTLNWKTYENKTSGILFKYPPELYLNVQSPTDSNLYLDVELYFDYYDKNKEGLPPYDNISIHIRGNDAMPEFSALFKAAEGSDVPEAHHAVDVIVTKLNNTKFQNFDSVEYIRDGISIKRELGRGPIGYSYNKLIKVNNAKYIRVTNDSMDKNKTTQRKDLFNKIIETMQIK